MQFKIGRLDSFVSDILSTIGYRVVQARVKGVDDKKVVQIMFERVDGVCVTISDCERATKALSKKLDDENFIRGAYNLELSSCGIDRPLVTKDDFVRFCGKYVKTRLYGQVDSRKNLDGLLLSADEDGITVEYHDPADSLSLVDNVKAGRVQDKSTRLMGKKKDSHSVGQVKKQVKLGYDEIRSANIDGWRCLENGIKTGGM